LQLALEVVHGLLDGSDVGIELVVTSLLPISNNNNNKFRTHVVDGGKTETETTWDTHTEGDLAILAVLRNGNVGTNRSIKVTESDGDGSPVGWREFSIDMESATGGTHRSRHSRQIQRGNHFH
jgi:hypothetical protein